MPQATAARPPLLQNEDVREETRKSLTQSATAFNRCDVETILGLHASDAVALPPNSPAVPGSLGRPRTSGNPPHFSTIQDDFLS
jgi:hypothetical protein